GTPCTPCKCATRLRHAPTWRDYNPKCRRPTAVVSALAAAGYNEARFGMTPFFYRLAPGAALRRPADDPQAGKLPVFFASLPACLRVERYADSALQR
ncbi:MAG TPA: hypothetical protein PKA23_13875, partial [Accumulibacter sp.]|nr:hypothetical protein [Accumulibacter sp.]